MGSPLVCARGNLAWNLVGIISLHVRFDFAKENHRRIGWSFHVFAPKQSAQMFSVQSHLANPILFIINSIAFFKFQNHPTVILLEKPFYPKMNPSFESKRMWICKYLFEIIRKAQIIRVLIYWTPNEDNIVHGEKPSLPANRRPFIDRHNFQLIYF